MTYDETRDAEQLRLIEPSIDRFIEQVNQTGGATAGTRRTVFLFPGGLASRLWRARQPFDDSVPTAQTFDYDLCWVTPLSLLGGALDLAMNKVAPEVYRDKDNRIIVADGAVDLDGVLDLPDDVTELAGPSLYSDFSAWCTREGFDCFVFGWDWRRKMQHTGRFFIDKFLPHFQARVIAGCGGIDPLADFSLVGHSAGGMIVNWLLRTGDPALANLRRVVSVGTPFYGYAGQVHRWFEGDPLVNGPGGILRDSVIRMISTLPACYAWQFMDVPTYLQCQSDFQGDPDYPLNEYPSMDQTVPALPADPYHPLLNVVGSDTFTRYPTNTGFDQAELASAAALVAQLAAPLTAAQMTKFFNIRAVQETPGLAGLLGKVLAFFGIGWGGAIESNTAGSIRWAWFPTSGGPTIVNGPQVPGDGTQPAWTARHLGLAKALPDHVITVTGLDVDHAVMMNAAPVLDALGTALQ